MPPTDNTMTSRADQRHSYSFGESANSAVLDPGLDNQYEEVQTMKKALPKCKSEDHERDFWSDTDSTEYVDWDSAKRVVLPRLKPSRKTISLRLPAMMLAELKRLANKRDVPYQSLLKVFLAERLEEELRGSRSK